jgi:hypothetical protein
MNRDRDKRMYKVKEGIEGNNRIEHGKKELGY